MIHRVFAHEVLPCQCEFTAGTETVQAKIAQLSCTKAILQNSAVIEPNSTLQTKLHFPSGYTIELEARVASADHTLLFVVWVHPYESGAADLHDLMMAELNRYQDSQGEVVYDVPEDPTPAPEEEVELVDSVLSSVDLGSTQSKVQSLVPSSLVPTDRLDSDIPLSTPEVVPPESIIPEGQEDHSGNIRSTILSRARTVDSSELAARSKKVRVLGMSVITSLVQEAVYEAFQLTEVRMDDDQRRQLIREAEDTFNERLSALQAEKAGVDAQLTALRTQLGRAQSLLDEERGKVVEENQFTVSDAGMEALERRLDRFIERSVEEGKLTADAEEEIRDVVGRILDDEREKITEQAREAQSKAITILERKVDRLATHLESTQKERDNAEARARLLEASGGGQVRNIYTPGLEEDDPTRSQKLGLLKELIADNKAVREHLRAKGKLPRLGSERETDAESALAPPEVTETAGGLRKIAVKETAPPPLEPA